MTPEPQTPVYDSREAAQFIADRTATTFEQALKFTEAHYNFQQLLGLCEVDEEIFPDIEAERKEWAGLLQGAASEPVVWHINDFANYVIETTDIPPITVIMMVAEEVAYSVSVGIEDKSEYAETLAWAEKSIKAFDRAENDKR